MQQWVLADEPLWVQALVGAATVVAVLLVVFAVAARIQTRGSDHADATRNDAPTDPDAHDADR